MYFLFVILHGWRKRSDVQPQTICSEIPLCLIMEKAVFRILPIRKTACLSDLVNLQDLGRAFQEKAGNWARFRFSTGEKVRSGRNQRLCPGRCLER